MTADGIGRARRLDRTGAKIIELNLADDFVANSVGRSVDRCFAGVAEAGARGGRRARSVPPSVPRDQVQRLPLFKETGVAIAVCQRPAKGLEFDLAKATVKGPGVLSQTLPPHGRRRAWRGRGGRRRHRAEAYLAHLTEPSRCRWARPD